MKRTVFAVFALLASTLALTQEIQYEPLLVAGRTWNVAEVQYGDTMNQWTDRIDCEVEFQGRKCFQVSRIYSDLVMEMFPELAQQHRYMYEENGKVYATNNYEEDAKWTKTFDFTLMPGQEGCVAVNHIMVNGTPRRQLYMGNQTVWVEGIGNVNYGLVAYGEDGEILPVSSNAILTSVYDGALRVCTYNNLTFVDVQAKTMFGEQECVWAYYVGAFNSPSFKRKEPNGELDLATYGTTTINGKTYHPIYMDIATHGARAMGAFQSPFFIIDESRMIFGIREEGGRIYVDKNEYLEYWKGNRIIGPRPHDTNDLQPLPYPVTDDGEVILYDFNMQVGDKFPEIEGRETVFVEGIEMIKCLDNTERKLFHLSNGCDIIEGVGAINGCGFLLDYLSEIDYLSESTRMFAVQYLYAFYKNMNMYLSPHEGMRLATLVFGCNYEYALEHSKDIIDRYMDDMCNGNVDGVESIVFPAPHDRPIFDLQGRCLTTQPQRGVYIRDGRKYVVGK